MFGKNILISIFLTLIFSACAQPKYITESSLENTDSETVQETKIDCSLTFARSGLCLYWYWEKKTTSIDKGSLIFKTYELNTLDQTPVEVDHEQIPNLILWMPSMGHGSSPTKVDRLDVGTYRASNVFFIMPGEWELKFQIQSGTEITDEAKVQILF
jgi:hypothetical protein